MPSKTKRKAAAGRSSSTSSSNRRRVAADDLLRYVTVAEAQLSPDGRVVLFTRKHVGDRNEYVTNLWVVDASGKSEPRQFTSGGKDTQPRWNAAGDRIAFISGREKGKPQICTIPAAGGEAVALTSLAEGSIGAFKWSPDGKTIAFSFREQDPEWTSEAKKARTERNLSDPPRVLDDWWYRLDGDGYFNAQRYHLHLVEVATGKHRKVYDKDNMGGFSFDFSPDSKKLVIATNRDRRAMVKPWKAELLILDIARGTFRSLPGLPEGPKEKAIWSPDGKWIAFAGRLGMDSEYSTENLEVWVCDAKTGHGARSLTEKDDYCLMAPALSDASEVSFAANIRWSPDSKRIFMQLGWHGESHIASVGLAGGHVHMHTRGAATHGMGSISDDGKTIAFTMGSATKLDEVCVGRIAPAITPRVLTDFNGPLLRGLELARLETHWLTTEDGAKVQLWAMKPAGFKRGKRYPAVLEIHGGPHAQYGVGYFHEFQFLCANGCVVFYSNPRGSKGYGRDHCAAIRGAWGGADWTDIQAVTAFMQEQPFVNPKKLGVMGGSYGGYMTNWAISHTDAFAGAITDRCVSNLVSMGGNSDYVDEPDRYWEGNFWDRPEARWEQSPIKYFGGVRTPTLIIHSEGDLRCNVEQSEQVFSALKLLGVPTRFVRYPASTSHGMSRNGPPDLRIHRLNQILDWWKRHLK